MNQLFIGLFDFSSCKDGWETSWKYVYLVNWSTGGNSIAMKNLESITLVVPKLQRFTNSHPGFKINPPQRWNKHIWIKYLPYLQILVFFTTKNKQMLSNSCFILFPERERSTYTGSTSDLKHEKPLPICRSSSPPDRGDATNAPIFLGWTKVGPHTAAARGEICMTSADYQATWSPEIGDPWRITTLFFERYLG